MTYVNNNSINEKIIGVIPEQSFAWRKWFEILKNYLENISTCNFSIEAKESPDKISIVDNDFPFDKDDPSTYTFMLTPLFVAIYEKILPIGLEIVKHMRLNKGYYNFIPIFIITSQKDIPHYFDPEKPMFGYAKNILGKTEFNHTHKAVFLAELLKKNNILENNNLNEINTEYLNLLNLFDIDCFKKFNNKINDIKTIIQDINLSPQESWAERKRLYYNTFVKFYKPNPFQDIDKIKINDLDLSLPSSIPNQEKEKIKSLKVRSVLDFATSIYNLLNNITEESSHESELEPFLSPVPFHLQELFEAEKFIYKKLQRNNSGIPISTPIKKIKLLLIDNNKEKITKENEGREQNSFKKMLESNDMFELKMLGDTNFLSADLNKSDINSIKFEDEIFHFEKFKKDTKSQYLSDIYNNIDEADFILLDFFLNKDNTYLAFDFIKDIENIKKRKGDFSTTWYFITSAVHDSVVKYAQSGLLAEHYESAVVNAGDDPTNEKRQLVFLYKILTFISSRIKNFQRIKKSIIDCRLFNNCFENECEKCLSEIGSLCQKYLAEYNDIAKTFHGLKDDKFKKIVELIQNTIRQFKYLPEADWPIIQRQIDLIDKRLKEISDFRERYFFCTYIQNEIKKRSQIY